MGLIGRFQFTDHFKAWPREVCKLSLCEHGDAKLASSASLTFPRSFISSKKEESQLLTTEVPHSRASFFSTTAEQDTTPPAFFKVVFRVVIGICLSSTGQYVGIASSRSPKLATGASIRAAPEVVNPVYKLFPPSSLQ